MKKNNHTIKNTKTKHLLLASILLIGAALFSILLLLLHLHKATKPDKIQKRQENPADCLLAYMDCVAAKDYEAMYAMLDIEASGNIAKEDFINRNSAIYEGIEMQSFSALDQGWEGGAAGKPSQPGPNDSSVPVEHPASRPRPRAQTRSRARVRFMENPPF